MWQRLPNWLIVLVEVVVVFGLSLLGNKLAENLNLRPGVVYVFTVLLLVTTFSINLAQRSRGSSSNQPSSSRPLALGPTNKVLIGVTLGMFTGLGSPFVVHIPDYMLLATMVGSTQDKFIVWPFEVVSSCVGVATTVIICLLNSHRTAVLFAIGFWTGMPIVVLALPFQSTPVASVLGHVAVFTTLVVLLTIFRKRFETWQCYLTKAD